MLTRRTFFSKTATAGAFSFLTAVTPRIATALTATSTPPAKLPTSEALRRCLFVDAARFLNNVKNKEGSPLLAGGWALDAQFLDQTGAVYLLAHGIGVPVADAVTVARFPATGRFRVWVRTYNWTSPWDREPGPGRFELLVNGAAVTAEKGGQTILGTTGERWLWQEAGIIQITDASAVELRLHDLTGFDGRCAALFFAPVETEKKDEVVPPDVSDGAPAQDAAALFQKFRKHALGLQGVEPTEVFATASDTKKKNKATNAKSEKFDLVVAGGGIAGICAALAAARLGLQVALVHDRPILGGNNSSEVRVHLGGKIGLGLYPQLGNLIREFGAVRGGNAQPADYYEDAKKLAVVNAEKRIRLLLNHRVVAVKVKTEAAPAAQKNGKEKRLIKSVIAHDVVGGGEVKLTATLFADCTGDAALGVLAGAKFRVGREGKAEFGEPSAPKQADKAVMGASIQWYSRDDKKTTTFPEFAYAAKFNAASAQRVRMGEWTWETGMNRDQVADAEQIRDYGMAVVYANWSFLKNHSTWQREFGRRSLDWVAFVAGKRESRRLIGDFTLREQDVLDFEIYPDATASTTWSIDLHYPDPANTRHFAGREFKSICTNKHVDPYPVPYRCLCSRDVANLFMAGRNISVTHVALGTTRVMRTCGMFGEVVGIAAAVAAHRNALPRDVWENQKYLTALKKVMRVGAGKRGKYPSQTYNA
ncbi:MAG: FAD-dependent oxidoreductase [Puniceicoccales bacterium]|nr:FAD-dependent oxidoreductase [Puniceicoccales bacterium]